MANNIKKEKRNKTGHDIPPDDRNTTNTVLPKQSNLGLVKPLDLAVTFQENRRTEKKEKKKKGWTVLEYIINKILTVGNSTGQPTNPGLSTDKGKKYYGVLNYYEIMVHFMKRYNCTRNLWHLVSGCVRILLVNFPD